MTNYLNKHISESIADMKIDFFMFNSEMNNEIFSNKKLHSTGAI